MIKNFLMYSNQFYIVIGIAFLIFGFWSIACHAYLLAVGDFLMAISNFLPVYIDKKLNNNIQQLNG